MHGAIGIINVGLLKRFGIKSQWQKAQQVT
jgi:hypothetical protein